MSEINEHISNSTESRDEKRGINYPNLSAESMRLKRKRNGNRNNFAEEKKAHRK